MKYELLFTEKMRKEVLEIGDSLAKYMHDNNIANIMLMDRSARPTYLTLKNSWKKNYPDVKCPNIYFTNPAGYDLEDKSVDQLSTEFNHTYTRLAENKDKPILLFDVCMHRGNTLKPVITTLKNAGYSNLIVGLTQPADKRYTSKIYPPISIDFTAMDKTPAGCCYPFRRDDTIGKHYMNLLSKPNPDSEWGRGIRREMNAIFKGYVEDNYYQ